MKNHLKLLLGMLAASFAGAGTSLAGVWIAGADGSMSVGGSTAVIEGDQFAVGGSSVRWTNPGVVGTDFVATTGGTAGTSDWYLQVSGASITSLNLTTENNRYVEVFYSIANKDFTIAPTDAADNRFFLSITGSGNSGQNPQEGAFIPNTTGSHSVVIDLLSSDGVNIDNGLSSATETWDQFRWDMWNNPANRTVNEGIEFTLDKVVYGNTLVPEPSSTALLGLGALGLFVRRRR